MSLVIEIEIVILVVVSDTCFETKSSQNLNPSKHLFSRINKPLLTPVSCKL